MCIDALERDESAGAHFREEHQTADGEALRDDENHAAVYAWEFQGDGKPPMLHREPLNFETVHLTQRSYKVISLCHSERSRGIPLRNPGYLYRSFDSARLAQDDVKI
jgi:hypothetical protein